MIRLEEEDKTVQITVLCNCILLEVEGKKIILIKVKK